MDNDELTGLVFVDFHKAFDILDHNLLLKKLSLYGANPDSVAWFQFIVSRRVMTVCETRAQNYTISAETCQERGTAGINPRSFFISPICE